RIARGLVMSFANTSTLKPGGSCSFASAGLSTSRGKFAEEGVSNGGGSAATSTLCTRPGWAVFQAGVPFGGPPVGGALQPGGPALADGVMPGGGPRRSGVASLNVPSFSAEKYAITLSRSSFFGKATTIAEPGTTVVGEVKKRSRVAASHVRWEFFNAFV